MEVHGVDIITAYMLQHNSKGAGSSPEYVLCHFATIIHHDVHFSVADRNITLQS